MSQGRIAEKGTYAELSARSDGEFRRLMQEFGGAADHDATDGGAHDGEVGAAAGAGAGAGAGAAAVVGGAGKQDSDGAAAAVARKQSVEVAADTAATAAADVSVGQKLLGGDCSTDCVRVCVCVHGRFSGHAGEH